MLGRKDWIPDQVQNDEMFKVFLETPTKKGADGLPFLFSRFSSMAYADFSSFSFAVKAGKTSL
jgi:hypothetical protein